MSDGDINVVGFSNKKSKKKPNFKVILAIIGIVVLALGIVAGIILIKEQQNISENAQEASCVEQCPGADNVLRNCHPPAEDGTPQESLCNVNKLVKFCGSRNYCCPSAGAAWTTNMTLCATATASPTPTATNSAELSGNSFLTSTPTATATGTLKSSATPTASASATNFPVPETGGSWSTMMGIGIGIIVILTSLVFAL